MKKDYFKPEMEVMEIITESMLSTSKLPVDGDNTTEGGDANEHRGVWGNIWN